MIATYTLAVRDPKNKTFGVITTSNFLSVGSLVPWIDVNAGIIVSQAFANPDNAVAALESMRNGSSTSQAIDDFLFMDDLANVRQIGAMDTQGDITLYTGGDCTPVTEMVYGEDFFVLGNMLIEGTTKAVADTFRETRGSGMDLGDAMIAAMNAGQKVGGDKRGKLASALQIYRPGGGYLGNSDEVVNLRVDAARNPLVSLGNLYGVFKLYNPHLFESEMIDIDKLTDQERTTVDALIEHLQKSEPVTLSNPELVAKVFARHNISGSFDAETGQVGTLLLSEAQRFIDATS